MCVMKSHLTRSIPIISILLLVTLACQISAGGPEPPEKRIPVSEEAAKSLEKTLQAAVETAATSEEVAVTLTEEQVTSYLALYMEKQPEPLIRNPQVYLQNGVIEIYGEVQQRFLTTSARVTVLANVDDSGQLRFDISAADFGPIPAPDAILNTMSAALNESLTGSLAPAVTGIRIQSVHIADGMLTVSGTRQ